MGSLVSIEHSERKLTSEAEKAAYRAYASKRITVLVLLLLLCVVMSIISLRSGEYHISSADVVRSVFHSTTDTHHVIIWDIRLPRILAALLVGSSLAVAGTVMQCILRNPLASPYTLGISNAAAFGAALSIMISCQGLFVDSTIASFFRGPYGMAIGAFVWSMVNVFIIILLAKATRVTPEAMVLAGIALSTIYGAALASLQYFADESTLAAIVYWQFGNLAKASWNGLGILFVLFVPIISYFLFKRWDYNAMDVGDDVATSLGVNTTKTRVVGMTLAATLTAVCVSLVGIIGFVGLLGPHIVRRLIGNDNRYVIPISAVMGIVILLISDYIGRFSFNLILPVGIITSFLGGPLFLYILLRGYRKDATC